MKDLGSRLKALRKQAGLSQTAIANEISVSYSQYGRYELKGVQPPAGTLNKLAEVLNTTVDFLINGNAEEKAQATLKNAQLLQKFKELEALPDKEQNILLSVINAFLRDYKTQQAYANQ
jgi:transcriptional regulator with XRE-family HTH domain